MLVDGTLGSPIVVCDDNWIIGRIVPTMTAGRRLPSMLQFLVLATFVRMLLLLLVVLLLLLMLLLLLQLLLLLLMF